MIIGDIIQRIQSLYSKGVQSDDTRLKSRHIYNVLITNRNNKLLTVYRLGVFKLSGTFLCRIRGSISFFM